MRIYFRLLADISNSIKQIVHVRTPDETGEARDESLLRWHLITSRSQMTCRTTSSGNLCGGSKNGSATGGRRGQTRPHHRSTHPLDGMARDAGHTSVSQKLHTPACRAHLPSPLSGSGPDISSPSKRVSTVRMRPRTAAQRMGTLA